MRGPIEPGQFVSLAYTQTLSDHGARRSLGSIGDALDNAPAESWVDSLKTELIADRVWRSRAHLEIAVVEYIGWFNHVRLHSSLGYLPPVKYEAAYRTSLETPGPQRHRLRPAPKLVTRPSPQAGLSDLRYESPPLE